MVTTPRHSGPQRLLIALATRSKLLSVLAIIAGLTSATTVTYVAGGTHTAMPHLFYLPVVAAASRFREAGALVVAVVAGLLVGPLMPLDVGSRTAQAPLGWLIRMAFLVIIGQTVALLSHRSLGGFSRALADHRTRLELEQALRRGELQVVYQPLYALADGRLVGAEALLRWHHPRRGLIAPDAFIAAAERTGLIVPIGLHVLRQAVSQLSAWRSLPDGGGVKVAVNVSARQLEDDALLDQVADILAATGVPAEALQLEVTETAIVTDLAGVTRRLQQLRDTGIAIAIDDFGTGQSSLAYLHRFPADVVKIDRSFVAGLEQDGQARAVASAVVRLALEVGATTVAEGIETQQQADTLRSLGCHVAQGYFYGRPDGADAILALLAPAEGSPSTTGAATVAGKVVV